MKIYVATSWRNVYQPAVVTALRSLGCDVYDFRHPVPSGDGSDGFSWREVDPEWANWNVPRYLDGLQHLAAERGFRLDMEALQAANLCVMVMPCGMSASLETGYAVGAGKPTAVYVPELREPDLMVKMADLITADLQEILVWAERHLREATSVSPAGR